MGISSLVYFMVAGGLKPPHGPFAKTLELATGLANAYHRTQNWQAWSTLVAMAMSIIRQATQWWQSHRLADSRLVEYWSF